MDKGERMALGVFLGGVWYLLIAVLGMYVFWVGLTLLLLIALRNPIGHLIAAIRPKWLLPYRKVFGPPLSDAEKEIIAKMKLEGLL